MKFIFLIFIESILGLQLLKLKLANNTKEEKKDDDI